MEGRRRLIGAWALCIGWMAVIFAMSAAPGDVSGAQSGRLTRLLAALLSPFWGAQTPELETLELLIRKTAHMAEYAVLFLLQRRALRLSGVRRAGAIALLLAVGYAATDELHQSFVPDRGPSVIDVAIDGCGALLGWGAAAVYDKIKEKKSGQGLSG